MAVHGFECDLSFSNYTPDIAPDFAGQADCCKFAAPYQPDRLKFIYDEKNSIRAYICFL
jgi:hypothetical protein